MAEYFYQRRTHGIVHLDEPSAVPMGFQIVVPISAEYPDLGAIVGAVNAGSNVAALR